MDRTYDYYNVGWSNPFSMTSFEVIGYSLLWNTTLCMVFSVSTQFKGKPSDYFKDLHKLKFLTSCWCQPARQVHLEIKGIPCLFRSSKKYPFLHLTTFLRHPLLWLSVGKHHPFPGHQSDSNGSCELEHENSTCYSPGLIYIYILLYWFIYINPKILLLIGLLIYVYKS